MRAKHQIILSAIIAASALKLGPAHADSGLLVVGGNAAERERSVVGAAIESTVRSAGWSLPTKPLAKKDSDRLLSCSDSETPWSCIPASIGAAGIRDLLVVAVETKQADNGAPLVVITGKLFIANQQLFAIRQRFCEHCADDRLAEAGQSLTQQLIQELAVRSGRTVVVIKSRPNPAEIILDGTPVGATDATFNTFPGKHVAVVQKGGFSSEVREFTIEEGKTADLSFTLRPSALAASDPPPQSRPSPWVPRITIGAGAVLAVFGGISIYRGQTNGGPDGRYEYTRATAIGVVTGLIGLGALGTGFYVMWRDAGNATPGAGAPRTAIIGWSGRF